MTAPTMASPKALAGPTNVDKTMSYQSLYTVPSSSGGVSVKSVIVNQIRAVIPVGAASQTLSWGIVRSGQTFPPGSGQAWELLDSMPVNSQDPLTDNVQQVLAVGDQIVIIIAGSTTVGVTVTVSGAVLT
jgi:hypothetical protein